MVLSTKQLAIRIAAALIPAVASAMAVILTPITKGDVPFIFGPNEPYFGLTFSGTGSAVDMAVLSSVLIIQLIVPTVVLVGCYTKVVTTQVIKRRSASTTKIRER